jgi:hypothetical protein
LSNHPSLKASVDILPELPLVLDADFEDPEELSKLKDGTNLDEFDNEDLLQQNELEFDQESTTSEEEEDDEPSDARKTRKNTVFREQEKELSEFYQLVCSECNSKWTSFATLSCHCKQTHNCQLSLWKIFQQTKPPDSPPKPTPWIPQIQVISIVYCFLIRLFSILSLKVQYLWQRLPLQVYAPLSHVYPRAGERQTVQV